MPLLPNLAKAIRETVVFLDMACMAMSDDFNKFLYPGEQLTKTELRVTAIAWVPLLVAMGVVVVPITLGLFQIYDLLPRRWTRGFERGMLKLDSKMDELFS